MSPYLDSTDKSLQIAGRAEELGLERPGSFGGVYPVRINGWANVQVALKRMRSTEDEEKNGEMTRLLEKEITALKLVSHPHVLRFYGLVTFYTESGIVMPWIERGSLRRCFTHKIEVDRAQILKQIALAVAYIHSGTAVPDGSVIVHGDIHAGNVLIDDNGSALLGDFGLCKLIPPNQMASLSIRDGRPHGVIGYMAPELHDDGALRTTFTDVFAFGILIYETYAGTAPIISGKGNKNELLIAAWRNGERPSRDSISNEELTDEIWEIATGCWEHNPEKRPTMREVCEDFLLDMN